VFIELVSALRCPAPHEETWLVAASARMAGRRIVEGVLGCPVCHAEYAIRDGVAHFAEVAGPPDDVPAPPVDEAEVMRAAALLDLAAPGGLVILGGRWDAFATPLAELTDARFLLVNPVVRVPPSEQTSAVRAGDRLPVAPASARAVALDAATASDARLTSAVRVLRPAGRLVAPAACALPAGVTELARDDRHWVAERAHEAVVSVPIALRRA
jgi:uncharacterized protein YbaR (Trm112 family)